MDPAIADRGHKHGRWLNPAATAHQEIDNNEDVEIREMRAFVTVVEEGSLSAAARKLHVSQSALSQTVQALERRLGVQLLLRSHTGARPTGAGKVLLQEVRELIGHHDRIVAAVSGLPAATGLLRIGVPLEFPVDLLPTVLTELSTVHQDLRVEVRHSSSVVQLAALQAGELDVALVRDRPADPCFDAVLAVEESMGVILATARSEEIAEAAGVRLHRLAGLAWIGFARSDTPAWYDQVAATLRGHGVAVADQPADEDRPVTPEVKLAAVGTGRAFAFASPGWARPLPEGMVWHPLIGDPIVRRTWAVWSATSRQRELAALIAALDLTMR
ncbi:LysR family transcriptional regulator [Streptosporangium lutulentum]|uniref:LysR family transcriptional regulator n=1 Tax=Streptosporangium lutulentum TaxID=1461250 RepID=UPI0036DDD6F6